MSADYVAIYALGLMLNSSRTKAGVWYAVWAPLLLVHLGGPDAITAYSLADTELWKRHALIMFYHLCVAAYLIFVSALPLKGHADWYRLAAAILVCFAGFVKYAERISALRFSSPSQIVSSTLPVDRFMQYESGLSEEDEYNYIVEGEKQFYQKFRNKGDKFDFTSESLSQMGIVTVRDVEEQYKKRDSDEYILCLSYALFKIYKRRFASLPFPEGNLDKTRRFFFGSHPSEGAGNEIKIKVFKIVEREMKFTYDYLFSKSSGTAFSTKGVVIRLANTSLLAVASFLTYSRLRLEEHYEASYNSQRVVTYILVSVAAVLEVFQLCRIIVSDWSMVSLACACIRHSRRPERIERYKAKLMKNVMFAARMLQKCFGDKYWQNRIQQHSLIQTCLSSSVGLLNVRKICLRIPACRGKSPETSPILSLYINLIVGYYMRKRSIDNDFKCFIYEKLKEYCDRDYDTRILPNRLLYSLKEDVYDKVNLRLSTGSWEREILMWHLATTICEGGKKDEDSGSYSEGLRESIRVTKMLSRYCAYLLVSCTSILPLHPDMASMEYQRVLFEIAGHLRENNITTQKVVTTEKEVCEILEACHSENKIESESIVSAAIDLAGRLLEKSAEERWGILNKLWAALLLYYAFFYKATVHAERLAAGGEFLSQLWALLAHLGFGEQSDSAVRHRGTEWTKPQQAETAATQGQQASGEENTHETGTANQSDNQSHLRPDTDTQTQIECIQPMQSNM